MALQLPCDVPFTSYSSPVDGRDLRRGQRENPAVANQAGKGLACEGFPPFDSFQFVHVLKSLLELNDRRILGVHLEQVDEMRRSGAIEDAFLYQKYRIAVGVAVEHCPADASARAGAGDQERIDVFAHEVRNQMGSKER